LWCESQVSDHRWRLQFQLRGHDDYQDDYRIEETAHAIEPSGDPGAVPNADAAEVVVADEAVAAGEHAIRQVFEGDDVWITTETLVAHLEQVVGYGKTAWPLPVIRRFVDGL